MSFACHQEESRFHCPEEEEERDEVEREREKKGKAPCDVYKHQMKSLPPRWIPSAPALLWVVLLRTCVCVCVPSFLLPIFLVFISPPLLVLSPLPPWNCLGGLVCCFFSDRCPKLQPPSGGGICHRLESYSRQTWMFRGSSLSF